MPGLRLKGQEDRRPSLRLGIENDEATVRPGGVVLPVLVVVALIHMHVVNPVARLETEDEIRALHLRTPASAICVEPRGRIRDTALHAIVEKLDQVVMRTWSTIGNAAHLPVVEHATALVIESQPAWPGRHAHDAV